MELTRFRDFVNLLPDPDDYWTHAPPVACADLDDDALKERIISLVGDYPATNLQGAGPTIHVLFKTLGMLREKARIRQLVAELHREERIVFHESKRIYLAGTLIA